MIYLPKLKLLSYRFFRVLNHNLLIVTSYFFMIFLWHESLTKTLTTIHNIILHDIWFVSWIWDTSSILNTGCKGTEAFENLNCLLTWAIINASKKNCCAFLLYKVDLNELFDPVELRDENLILSIYIYLCMDLFFVNRLMPLLSWQASVWDRKYWKFTSNTMCPN